jgi:hypothetical protein
MKAAAEAAGIAPGLLKVASGYRSVERQRAIWAQALQRYGSPEAARRWVAPPGGSVHHTGRAVDLSLGLPLDSSNVDRMRLLPVWRWLTCNAARFGFAPYSREPWHWEYQPGGVTSADAPASTRERIPREMPVNGRSAPARSAPARSAPARSSPAASAPAASATMPAPAPAARPAGAPTFTPAEEKAFRITFSFEGGLRKAAGNFDGTGLSLGALQWNLGTGSLQPLLLEFIRREPAAFDSIFREDARAFRDVLNRPIPEQVAFFDRVSIPPRKYLLREPWATRLPNLAGHQTFVQIQMATVRNRMDRAYRYLRLFSMTSERALAFMFDAVTSHGGAWIDKRGTNRRQLIMDAIRTENATTEVAKMGIIARVLGDTSSPRWKKNVTCRKLLIALGRLAAGSDCPQRYLRADLGRDFSLTDQSITVPPGRP